MVFIIIGILLAGVAVAGFFMMRRTRSELHTMIGTETLSIPELEDHRRTSDELGAKGGFRKVTEVTGAAQLSQEGALISEISKTECVWYRYRIDRQYEHVEYRDGKRHTSRRSEQVAEHTSWQGYALIDDQGRTIGVDPGGTNPDGVEQTVDRFEPHHGGDRADLFGIELPSFFSGNDSTIGFDYKEWVIRPGRRMYILGEVHDKIGPLVIARPENGGHFVISTRTEDELREDRVRKHKLQAIGVIAAFAVGLAFVVVGIVR
ncbi:MAG: E3 ubiquitin ligase family protein [Kibdelosporangium sp.]